MLIRYGTFTNFGAVPGTLFLFSFIFFLNYLLGTERLPDICSHLSRPAKNTVAGVT
jgi:hypothetical protein